MGISRIVLDTVGVLVKVVVVAFLIGLAVGLVLGVRAGLDWDDLPPLDILVGGR